LNVNCGSGSIIALRAEDGGWPGVPRKRGHDPLDTGPCDDPRVRQVIFATQQGLVSWNPRPKSALVLRLSFSYDMWLAASPVVFGDLV
jgi:hypothetical protein